MSSVDTTGAERMRRYRNARTAIGLCPGCCSREKEPGRSRCAKCADYHRLLMRRVRSARPRPAKGNPKAG